MRRAVARPECVGPPFTPTLPAAPRGVRAGPGARRPGPLGPRGSGLRRPWGGASVGLLSARLGILGLLGRRAHKPWRPREGWGLAELAASGFRSTGDLCLGYGRG